MISELNRLIENGSLPVAPFSDQGLSVTPTAEGALFLLDDEKCACVRIYTNAAPLSASLRDDPAFLLSLLMLGGPAGPAPEVRIGADLRANFLWLSAAVPYSECTGPLFAEKLERCRTQSALLRAEVIRRMNERGQERTLSRPASAPVTPAPQMTSDDLSRLFSSSQVYWG